MGPTEAFLEEELAALDAYRARGGALWVAMDPGGKADLNPLLEPLGLAYDGGAMLVGTTNVWVATRRVTDHYNIFTNKTSTPPSVTTLSRNSKTRAAHAARRAAHGACENAPYKVEVRALARGGMAGHGPERALRRSDGRRRGGRSRRRSPAGMTMRNSVSS